MLFNAFMCVYPSQDILAYICHCWKTDPTEITVATSPPQPTRLL